MPIDNTYVLRPEEVASILADIEKKLANIDELNIELEAARSKSETHTKGDRAANGGSIAALIIGLVILIIQVVFMVWKWRKGKTF